MGWTRLKFNTEIYFLPATEIQSACTIMRSDNKALFRHCLANMPCLPFSKQLLAGDLSKLYCMRAWPRGLMEKASDFGSEDSRFESWRGRCVFVANTLFSVICSRFGLFVLQTAEPGPRGCETRFQAPGSALRFVDGVPVPFPGSSSAMRAR